MNENRTIMLIVTSDGKAKVETHGFTGSTCKDASKFLETALGQTTAEQLKAPYFLNETHQHHLEISR